MSIFIRFHGEWTSLAKIKNEQGEASNEDLALFFMHFMPKRLLAREIETFQTSH
jgi:hypothetical protein